MSIMQAAMGVSYGVGLLFIGDHSRTLINFKLEKMNRSIPRRLPFLIDEGSIDVLIHAQHMNVIVAKRVTLYALERQFDQRACHGADLFL